MSRGKASNQKRFSGLFATTADVKSLVRRLW